MPQTETSIAQTLAAKLDVIPLDVFQQAVNAVYAYESETDEWIAEHDAMVGDDIEDEDAKDAAYDQFTGVCQRSCRVISCCFL